MLKAAVQQNYCAYSALLEDPLLKNLRKETAFNHVLTAASECQQRGGGLQQRICTPNLKLGELCGGWLGAAPGGCTSSPRRRDKRFDATLPARARARAQHGSVPRRRRLVDRFALERCKLRSN